MTKTITYNPETNEEAQQPKCKTHPDAPHGFLRNASHSADRYVCECEFWEPLEQPANMNTHGEPDSRKVATATGFIDERFGPELNWHKPWANFPKGTNFYTSPQTTPMELRSGELVQAARMALDALNPRPGMPNPEYESLVACATRELQNALKEST